MRIEYYVTASGERPFSRWIESLEDVIQARIYAYVVRVAEGGAKKNVKPVGEGVFEIKVDKGPGYRVYFGLDRGTSMILLLGGDKGTQRRDIQAAIQCWSDFHA